MGVKGDVTAAPPFVFLPSNSHSHSGDYKASYGYVVIGVVVSLYIIIKCVSVRVCTAKIIILADIPKA